MKWNEQVLYKVKKGEIYIYRILMERCNNKRHSKNDTDLGLAQICKMSRRVRIEPIYQAL